MGGRWLLYPHQEHYPRLQPTAVVTRQAKNLAKCTGGIQRTKCRDVYPVFGIRPRGRRLHWAGCQQRKPGNRLGFRPLSAHSHLFIQFRTKFLNPTIMTITKHIPISTALVTILLAFSACNNSFLEKPPTDAIVDANFYQTDDQVLAATALLYSKVWFDYNDKASYNLGDFRAGTAYSAYNDRGNVLFNTTGDTPDNGAAWRSFFIVVGQANLAIQNIQTYAGSAVSPTIKQLAIAEARFMRALAYRFLVMNWGAVPIIENNLTLLSDTTIQRNTPESVWKFITNEMRAAAEDLPEEPIRPGRLTKWSAE